MKRFIKYLFFSLIFGITCITLVGCKEQEKKQDCNNYNMIVNNVEENGIGLKMTKLAATSSSLSNSITINATVNPSNAVNKKITWTLAWKTSKSDSVSDYVTMSVSSDTLACTLTYVKNFDTRIILTATSVANSSVSATCNLDCIDKATKITSIGIYGTDWSTELGINGIADSNNCIEITRADGKQYNFDVTKFNLIKFSGIGNSGYQDSIEYEIDEGDLLTEFSISYKFTLSSDLKDKFEIERYEWVVGINEEIEFSNEHTEQTQLSFMDIFSLFVAESAIESGNKEFKECLSNTTYWFDLIVTIDSSYGKTNYSYKETFKLKGFNVA